jgi:hypothetical protein
LAVTCSFFDVNGYLGHGPTITGLNDFIAWTKKAELFGTLRFLETGETEDIAHVIKEMEHAKTDDPDREEIRVALLDAARRAELILILSDE